MDVVFFSLRTKAVWAMTNCNDKKKREKLKKFNPYGKVSWKWTLFSSLFVRRRPKWAMMNCNVKKKREKLKELNFTSIRSLNRRIVRNSKWCLEKLKKLNKHVVFFSLRTKTAESWAMMNCNVKKKREKLKKINFTSIRSSNSHQNSKLSQGWT